MTIERDVLGYRYDDVEPAFVLLEGGFYYHLRHPKKKYNKVEFDAWMTEEELSFGANELGVPSLEYLQNHETILWSFDAGTLITASVTKVPTATPDDTGEITIAGGPNGDFTVVNITMQDSTSGESHLASELFYPSDAETADEIATAMAAHLNNDPNLTSVVAVGAVITYTPSTGGTITELSVNIDHGPVK